MLDETISRLYSRHKKSKKVELDPLTEEEARELTFKP
jgi:hypothetical protein